MYKILRSLMPLGILLVAAGPVALGSGGSSNPATPSTPSVSLSPEQQAGQYYDRGLKMRDKAWNLEEKAEKAGTESERAKLETKALKQYTKSIEQFRSAIRLMPNAYQAYSSLGYALRKTGDYTSSLEAYSRSLSLKPGYAEAIEYRAEAYLGLNRIEEAKQAYVELFGQDRTKADELLDAMKQWVQKRREQPDGLDGAVVDGFAGWVSEREEIAGQTASVSQLKEHSW